MVTWFGNIKTMWKLMLGFALMGVIMCVLGGVSAQGLLSVRENLRIVYEDYTVAATDLARASTNLTRYRNGIFEILGATDQAAADKVRAEIPRVKESMVASLGAYAATVLRVSKSGRDESKDLKVFREALDRYLAVTDEVLALAAQTWQAKTPAEAAQFTEKAKAMASKQGLQNMIAANNALDELLKTVQDVAKDMNEDGRASAASALVTLAIGTVTAIVIGLLMGWLIAHLLARNLNNVVMAAQALGGGDLKARSSVTTQDEVGQLAQAFNQMGEQIQTSSIEQQQRGAVSTALEKVQAVIEFNLDGTVITANQNFLSTVGYSLDEITGRHHRMFCEPAYANSPEYQAFWAKLNRGELDAGAYRRLGTGGKEVWLQASYNPVFDSNGKPCKVVKFATDITGQKQAQLEVEKLIKAVAAGQLAERIKTDQFEGASKALTQSFNQLLDAVATPLQEAQGVLTALAANDLTQAMSGVYQGEFEQMKTSLNAALTNLSTTVSTVRGAVEAVTDGSEEITKGNEDLSQRTAEQASALEETSASMEEMTSTVKQNADNAKQANQLAIAARDIADKGGAITTKAVEAMGEINKSSKKIADIITVIDEIAFQTNLLALNAAVEAARAGEHGRGFAVVAAEVRNLAQRSATAAKEIKGLINESIQRVTDGSELVDQSGKTLGEIVNSVKRVTDIIAEITAASQEQASGIDQVNKAIMQMDETTQQNAALVEETTSASQSMKDQAKELMRQMAVFKVNGTSESSHVKREASGSGTKYASRTTSHVTPKPLAKKPVGGAKLAADTEPVGVVAGNGKDRRQKEAEFEEF